MQKEKHAVLEIKTSRDNTITAIRAAKDKRVTEFEQKTEKKAESTITQIQTAPDRKITAKDVEMKAIEGGLVVTTCGGPGPLGYKESYLGDHLIDRAIRYAFKNLGLEPLHYPFRPDGSDERQYSSPGFRIPVATITRDKYYEYSQYHTSLDNLDFVNGSQLLDSFRLYCDVASILDLNRCYRSTAPYGEPQLSRRKLYPTIGGGLNQKDNTENTPNLENEIDVITWLLFTADGEQDLLSVANRSSIEFSKLQIVAEKLTQDGLLESA